MFLNLPPPCLSLDWFTFRPAWLCIIYSELNWSKGKPSFSSLVWHLLFNSLETIAHQSADDCFDIFIINAIFSVCVPVSHLFDYCMCVKSDRTQNKHTDSWSQWCPTNHSVRRPTTNIWDSPKLSKTSLVCWPGGAVRDPASPSRTEPEPREGVAWSSRPGPARLLDRAWASISPHHMARRFWILLSSSLRCTGHLQQAGPHCQFTHDKPFRVKSWPYWSSWVVSSWLSRTRSIVLLPDGLAVTTRATEDQPQFFSADNRETSQSSPSV